MSEIKFDFTSPEQVDAQKEIVRLFIERGWRIMSDPGGTGVYDSRRRLFTLGDYYNYTDALRSVQEYIKRNGD